MKKSKDLEKVVISAMFLSLSVIAASFISLDIPIFGMKGFELNPSSIFYSFPALLFGPFYGAVVAGLTDFLSFLIRPSGGAYIPWISLVIALGGLIKGFMWLFLKKLSDMKVRLIALILVLVIGIFGISNLLLIKNDGLSTKTIASKTTVLEKEEVSRLLDDGKVSYPSKLAFNLTTYAKAESFKEVFARNLNFLSLGFLLAFFLGLILLLIDLTMFFIDRKKNKTRNLSYIKVLIAVLIPSLLVTTLNTQVLILFVSVFSGRSFLLVWIPRIIPSIISHTIQAYFIAILYDLYIRVFEKKNSINPG